MPIFEKIMIGIFHFRERNSCYVFSARERLFPRKVYYDGYNIGALRST